MHLAARVGAEVVPLVGALPARLEARGGGVRGVLDLDGRGRRARRVVGEVGADQLAVPGPVVLGVRGRVDAGEPAAALDVALEGALLGLVEHVTGGGEEDDDLVLGEVRVGEGAGVLGGGRRVKSFSVPSCWIAAMASSMLLCRNAAVLEKTSASNASASSAAAAASAVHGTALPSGTDSRRALLPCGLLALLALGLRLGAVRGLGRRRRRLLRLRGLGRRGAEAQTDRGCQRQRHDRGQGRAQRDARALPQPRDELMHHDLLR